MCEAHSSVPSIMEFTLSLPKNLKPDGVLLHQFTTFCSRFDCYRRNTGAISNSARQTSVLLFAAHCQVTKLTESLKFYGLDLQKLTKILEVVEQTCLPLFILLFERFRFFTLEQDASDSAADFVKTLRKQGELCEFGNIKDSLLSDALVSRAQDDSILLTLKNSKELCFDDMVNLYNKLENQSHTDNSERSQTKQPSSRNTASEQWSGGDKRLMSDNDNVSEEADEDFETKIDSEKKRASSSYKLSKRKRQYLCNICGSKYLCRRSLRRHMCSKHPDAPCKLCKVSHVDGIETVIRCKYHVPTEAEKKFLCWYCDTPFSDQNLYRQHCLTHSTIGVFRCDLCQTKHSITRIIGHLRGHLSPKYKCEICSTHFNKSESLAAHKKTHSTRQIYPCPVCSKTFVRADRLKEHKRTHLGKKRYTCELCGKSFSQKMSFVYHARWHSGEKPYECEICGARARTSGDLRKHKRVHSDKRPYVCEVCGKSFRCISNLNRHRKSHSGKRSYVCDVCGRTFIYVEGLRDHIKAGRCPGRQSEGNRKDIAKPKASKETNSVSINIAKPVIEGTFTVPAPVVNSTTVWPTQSPPESLLHDFTWQYTQGDGATNPVVFPSYYSAPPYM